MSNESTLTDIQFFAIKLTFMYVDFKSFSYNGVQIWLNDGVEGNTYIVQSFDSRNEFTDKWEASEFFAKKVWAII